MPLWLLECLLQNKTPSVPLTKVSFVLLPFKEPGVEPLPELLNTYVRFPLAYPLDTEGFMRQLCRQQSKLTASRFLRVRKLTVHVSYPYVADLSRMLIAPPGPRQAREDCEWWHLSRVCERHTSVLVRPPFVGFRTPART